jgi:hypothetical protein
MTLFGLVEAVIFFVWFLPSVHAKYLSISYHISPHLDPKHLPAPLKSTMDLKRSLFVGGCLGVAVGGSLLGGDYVPILALFFAAGAGLGVLVQR